MTELLRIIGLSVTENMLHPSVRYENERIKQREIYFVFCHRMYKRLSLGLNKLKTKLT